MTVIFNAAIARTQASDLIALYPDPRSALIPLCHLAQEQDGWLRSRGHERDRRTARVSLRPRSRDGNLLRHVAHRAGRDLRGVGLHQHRLLARWRSRALEHAEESLGVRAGSSTPDGVFTLEESECLADCDRTPCVQVNHRYVGGQTPETFDRLID